jgi:hypothetical protein
MGEKIWKFYHSGLCRVNNNALGSFLLKGTLILGMPPVLWASPYTQAFVIFTKRLK